MSDEGKAQISLYADNILKALLAGLIGLLTWIGTQLQGRVAGMERDITQVKIDIAAMRSDIKYLGK